MADAPTPVAEAPVNAPTAPEVPVVAKAAPKIVSSKSLSDQHAALTKIMQDMPDKPVEPVVEPDKPADQPVEDKQVLDAAVETVDDAPSIPESEEEEDEQPKPAADLGTWQEYVVSKLPTITARIKDGEGFKTLQVKSDSELPAGFEFADDAARSQFARDIAGQEVRAGKLLDEFNQKQAQENVRLFEIQEAKDVASDLAYLQRAGVIPKFQYQDDDPKFNSDPAVKEANAIYKLYKDTNNEYMRKYMGSNRTFRISYRDAADKYYAQQSRLKPAEIPKSEEKPAPKPKTPLEKERDEVSRKQGAPQGGEAGTTKPRAFKGMGFDEINRLVRMDKI